MMTNADAVGWIREAVPAGVPVHIGDPERDSPGEKVIVHMPTTGAPEGGEGQLRRPEIGVEVVSRAHGDYPVYLAGAVEARMSSGPWPMELGNWVVKVCYLSEQGWSQESPRDDADRRRLTGLFQFLVITPALIV